MANDETELLLNEIGQLLAKETGFPRSSVLLYAQLEPDAVGLDIFVEHSSYVEYSHSGNSLTDPLLDLWEVEEPEKRWAEMEYLLRNGKFTATFTYPGEVDPEEESDAFFARRRSIVARHFGDKPIVYPPWPDDGGQRFEV